MGHGHIPTDATDDLHVLGHDGDPLAVDGGELGVLEQLGEVGFGCYLQTLHPEALEADVVHVLAGDELHQAEERRSWDQQVGSLLVAADLL